MALNNYQTIQPFFDEAYDELPNDPVEGFMPLRNDYLAAEKQLSVDVYEDEKNLYVRSFLPGVRPENLDINIDGEILTIQGNRHEDLEQQADNFFCRECYWGEISRSIVLPVAVLSDKISATLNNGVLRLTLPKANY